MSKLRKQRRYPHPLGFHMWHFFQPLREAWWILMGDWSLHQAWQMGYDQHIKDESERRARGGK